MNKKKAAAWVVRLGSVALTTVVLGSIATNTQQANANQPVNNTKEKGLSDYFNSQDQFKSGQNQDKPTENNNGGILNGSRSGSHAKNQLRSHTRSRAS